MNITKIGYARAFTIDQSDEFQIQALEKAGCYQIYTDHGRTGHTMAHPSKKETRGNAEGTATRETLTIWKFDARAVTCVEYPNC